MDVDDCYSNLANAIVIKATKDYKTAKSTLAKDRNDCVAHSQIKSIKKFFRSNLFGLLTTIDPEYLIDRLDKEAKSIARTSRVV